MIRTLLFLSLIIIFNEGVGIAVMAVAHITAKVGQIITLIPNIV